MIRCEAPLTDDELDASRRVGLHELRASWQARVHVAPAERVALIGRPVQVPVMVNQERSAIGVEMSSMKLGTFRSLAGWDMIEGAATEGQRAPRQRGAVEALDRLIVPAS